MIYNHDEIRKKVRRLYDHPEEYRRLQVAAEFDKMYWRAEYLATEVMTDTGQYHNASFGHLRNVK